MQNELHIRSSVYASNYSIDVAIIVDITIINVFTEHLKNVSIHHTCLYTS
jgi:hypothetical protein